MFNECFFYSLKASPLAEETLEMVPSDGGEWRNFYREQLIRDIGLKDKENDPENPQV